MKVLITGGTGFIGLRLADRIWRSLEDDGELVLVDNFSRHGRRDPDVDRILALPRVGLVEADLTDPASFVSLGSGFDRVYALAGVVGVTFAETVPDFVLRTNVLSAILTMDWASAGGLAPGGKILFASTSEVYAGATGAGIELPVPTPEAVPICFPDEYLPRASYAASKFTAELYAINKFRGGDYGCSIVRYHNVYGPRMGTEHVIPQVIKRALDSEEPFVRFAKDQTRTFCFIEDAAEATIAVMESSRLGTGAVVNIGNDEREIRVADLYDSLLEFVGHNPSSIVDAPAPPGSTDRRCPDISKLRGVVGFEPKVSLRDGLRETVDWYRSWYAERGSERGRP